MHVFTEEHCLSPLLLQNCQMHSNLSSGYEWILISVSVLLPDKYLGNNLCDHIQPPSPTALAFWLK